MALTPRSLSRSVAAAPSLPMTLARRLHWDERYQSSRRPWDTGITPPEVKTFWHSGLLPPFGLAIDLGCGSGTNAIFLANNGLRAVGADLSGIALLRGQARGAQPRGPGNSPPSFVQADVSCLPFTDADASYILDIGCLHSIPLDQRTHYAHSVVTNLRPGGYYHLFAFDRSDDDVSDPEHRDQGMAEHEVRQLFTPDLALLTVLRGRPDQRPCRWYLLYKPTNPSIAAASPAP